MLQNIKKSIRRLFFYYPFSKSFRKQKFAKTKVYFFDVGFANLTSNSRDNARRLENLVFIELFRRYGSIFKESIYYWKNKKEQECDFLIEENTKINQAIQVTYELNENNKDREIKGLLEAMNYFDLKEGLILTYDQEDVLEIEDKKIIVKPVWRWLLE